MLNKKYIALFFAMLSLTVLSGTITLDNTASGKLLNWYCWPRKNINVKIVQDSGKNVILFDFRKQSGGAIKTVNAGVFKNTNPYAIKFKIKAAPGNQRKSINICVREGQGKEKYFKTVKIPFDWQDVELKLADLAIFTYGGHKVVDGRLDPNDIKSIRFECYPKGAVFMLADLQILTGKKVTGENVKKATFKSVIKKIKLSDHHPQYDNKYPASVQNVKIKGSNFVRDGKPVFLLGGWQEDNEGPPWLFRTLGIDVYPFNATEIYTLYPPEKNGKMLTLSWKANPWYEAIIHRTLKNGIMFWHEHKSHARYNVLKKNKIFDDVIDCGHFFTYDPFNPSGVSFYKEMYKSWMRHTRKYPVFCYELFNEVTYNNTKKISRQAFAKAMQKKYGTINRANQTWGTKFKSFNQVVPPGFITTSASVSKKSRSVMTRQDGEKYPNLFIDWQKFQEARSGEAFTMLMKIMRSYDPNPKKLSTLQSHCQLFFDFGDSGVHPEAIDACTDFYSHEIAQTFGQPDTMESIESIKKTLYTSLTNDIVRNITSKPIFNAESPLGVSRVAASEKELINTDAAGLSGEWKFFDGTKLIPNKWSQTQFNDDQWKKIKVPGMWGTQGFAQCRTGLYRKHFKLNMSKLKNKLYLNGQAFADKSEIYLNGKLVGNTSGYNSAFSFDVTDLLKVKNVLAVKIYNNYFSDGMYYGGIRGYVSLNKLPATFSRKPQLEPKHFRTHLWNQIVHGMSGVMVCYDGMLYNVSAKILPRVKKEIESVADIVMQRPRIESQIAIVYPFETNRGIKHKGYIEKLSGPANSDLVDYYAPMVFSGLGTDVIRNKDVVSGRADKYKMLVMAGNIRVLSGELKALCNYVKKGGILVADFGSISLNDDTHTEIEANKLLGINIKQFKESNKTLSSGPAGASPVKTHIRFADKKSHAEISTTTARVINKFTDGTAAVTVNRIGKGKVYFISGKLPYKSSANLLNYIMKNNRLTPAISIYPVKKAQKPDYVETNLFSKDNRYVLYALNYGKTGVARLAFNSIPDGKYLIRNIASNNLLNSPAKGKYWTAEELRDKFILRLPSLDPVVLLIEKSNLSPLTLKNISTERYRILDQLWTKRKSAAKAPVVAFAPLRSMTKIYGDQPTAEKLLAINGFKTVSYVDNKTDLKEVNVLIWTNTRDWTKNTKNILNFVKNGGGLMICGNGITNYHMSIKGIKPLLDGLKVNQQYFRWISNKFPAPGEDILRVACTDIKDHPVTANVREFKTACAGSIVCKAPGAVNLIKAPANSNLPGATVVAAFPYGKGRVVYVSDYWWLRPLNFEKGDNPQLFLNIINWLAKRNPVKLNDKSKSEALYISDSNLSAAEKAEKAGKYTFKPFSAGKSSLGDTDYSPAPAGGDPIVDILK
jgi:beta-galactosidase GanA